MVAVISGADNGSLFMPSGVLTFSSPFAILSFYRKHHYISNYEGRSANGEVIYLIRQCIDRFESEHGKIEMPKADK
jgi:hypothetical protein